MADKSHVDLVAKLVNETLDAAVQASAAKNYAEALIDRYIEEGIMVPSAKNDLIELFGKSIFTGDKDGKYVLAESYVNGDGLARAPGQDLDFAFRELIAMRPHFALPPPPTDLDAEAFGGVGGAPLKAQGRLVKEIGEFAAAARARDWGVTLGSTKVGKRPEVKGEQKPGDKAAAIADARRANPWSVDGPEAEAARLDIIGRNTAQARRLAAEAGKTITGKPRKTVNAF